MGNVEDAKNLKSNVDINMNLNKFYISYSQLIQFFKVEIIKKNNFSFKTDPSTTNGHLF